MSWATTAIALAGFNRPDCFRPTIQSLLTNEPIEQCDLWCFFDGGPDCTQSTYNAILAQALESSTFKPREVNIINRPHNFGCGRNLIDIRRRLFDQEGYEAVFVFEDDMILSPHYLALSHRLLEWSRSRFDDIGAVQMYNACHLSVDEKVCRLDEVDVGNPHWWGYVMPRTTWAAVRETLLEYEERFLQGVRYKTRNDHDIRRWALSKLGQRLEGLDTPDDLFAHRRRCHRVWDFLTYFGREFATGQDSMTVLAMTLAGLQKLQPLVNRSRPNGPVGLHSTREGFELNLLHQIELVVFESDAQRESFRLASADGGFLKPWMRADEVEAIRRVVAERRPARVLEFGAGGSTVTLSREAGISEWWSLEHDDHWLSQVASKLGPADAERVTLMSCPLSRVLDRLEQLLPLGFDMFFVDGFDRQAILDRLRVHLETQPGFVLLHDSSRKAYRSSIEQYARGTTLAEGDGKHQGLMVLEGGTR